MIVCVRVGVVRWPLTHAVAHPPALSCLLYWVSGWVDSVLTDANAFVYLFTAKLPPSALVTNSRVIGGILTNTSADSADRLLALEMVARLPSEVMGNYAAAIVTQMSYNGDWHVRVQAVQTAVALPPHALAVAGGTAALLKASNDRDADVAREAKAALGRLPLHSLDITFIDAIVASLLGGDVDAQVTLVGLCLLYTSPSPRDRG